MKSTDLERLKRSVTMLPPGQRASAMSREEALGLFDQLERLEEESDRRSEVLERIRSLLAEAGA
ncbi:MAG TPA: hypothetical protein VG435_10450 [Acidimicrobiales bacterium]|jgi:hypothetical protein|nr:hypothetical protein [Acidimicrobiales bacterium]